MDNERTTDIPEQSYVITDEVIKSLKPFSLKTIANKEIEGYIYRHCQRLLRLAKEKNDSNEIAISINIDTLDVSAPVFGDSRCVDIGYLTKCMKGTGYAFLVVHNHPSDFYFSRRDIKTFIDMENMTILIALGNRGSIYTLEKKRQLTIGEILDVRKILLSWKNDIITYVEVISLIENYGIIYSHV